MKLVLATANRGKALEISLALSASGVDVIPMKEAGYAMELPEETAGTFE
ncbi:MAG TPA: non-canonical purine NTP pyrophosphatase, partial [Planctomycetes bacterium]|nr:non-canonical purine NTP pyrophosphatase [Planctomycetota bacterium]